MRALTRPLAPRAYSIASSRREVGDEAHLLISAVRYESHGRARKGVASNYVAERLKRGDRVRVKLKPNKHFALPAPDSDIIMVGPGTGVAPFRAFVQERRADGGERQELAVLRRPAVSPTIFSTSSSGRRRSRTARSPAWTSPSRATRPEKIYVQDKMWDKRRELIDWLDGGAHFYVCGDAKNMAKDVRATLTRAYADVKALSPEAAEQASRAWSATSAICRTFTKSGAVPRDRD